MEITEIESSYSRKVQLEQFEPVEVSETITAVVEEGEDIDVVSKDLSKIVHDNVERRLTDRLLQKKMEDGKET